MIASPALPRPTPRAAFALVAVWATLVAFCAWFAIASPRYAHMDFVAFYCAGDAIARGADPYREIPLNACEHAITSGGLFATQATVPAPLPPYALLAFAALSRLPFDPAYLILTVSLIGALALGCRLLGRQTDTTLLVVVAAVASTALDNVRKGQPVPLVFLAIVAAGWALTRGRDRFAAACAVATLIEPHIGLTVCASLFLWRPRARPVLLLGGAILAAIALVAVPLHAALSYVTDVLPLQAASEAAWVTQLSVVNPLVVFGIPERNALALGMVQYVLLTCAGLCVAGRLVKDWGPEALAFVPPLFAMLGGTYLHGNALLLAIPGALFLAQRSGLVTGYVALALVALSWLSISEPVQLLIAVAAVVTIALAIRLQIRVALVAAVLVATVGMVHGSVAGVPRRAPATMAIEPTAFAERSWTEFVDAVNPPRQAQLVALLMKVPTWAGLIVLLSIAVSMAWRFGKTTEHEPVVAV